MARIGLNSFRYSKLTEAQDGTPSYAGALTPGKAISCNVSITNNDVKLYADDALAESDTSFSGGTVTMTVDNADLTTLSNLLGHTLSDTTPAVMTRNSNDTAPYVGLGRIIMMMVNNVVSYKVEFLYKVKFSEPSQDETTKGETVEFGTTELQGTIAQLASGKWSDTAVFTTKADALTYLEGLLGTTSV